MHYYQFHIGDYRAATAHLSNEEDLAFRRLLDMYYDTEKPIPEDTQWVARRLRVGIDVVVSVLNDMFVLAEDGWRHSRCDSEIAHYHELAAKNRENGKKGGRPKKPSGLPVETDREPKKTLTSNQEPITNTQVISQDKPAKRKNKTSLPNDFAVSQRVREWAASKGFDRLDEHLDAFRRKALMNAYTYMDWDLAFMEAIREDWAKLRGRQSFAQQAADIARVTVPGSTDPDPALQKIIEDRKKAVPPPANLRDLVASMKGVLK